MRRALVPLLLLPLVLVACTGDEAPSTPSSSATVSASQSPSSSATPTPTVQTPAGWETAKSDESHAPGEWLADVDVADRASATLAVGCAEPPDMANLTPVNAREGLLERGGAPGVALAFGFTDEEAAKRFQSAWVEQMKACDADTVKQVASETDYWAGHRNIDGMWWTESSVRQGQQVSFIAVQGKLSDDETRALSKAQQG